MGGRRPISWELEHCMNRVAILVKHSKKSDIRPKPKRLVVDEGENIYKLFALKKNDIKIYRGDNFLM